MGDSLLDLSFRSVRIWAIAVRVVRQPRFWLIAQLCGVIVAGACFGWWDVQYACDTDSYIATSQMPLPDAMRSFRTLGYPLLLKVANLLAPDFRAVPCLHLALFCGTVLFFDASLRRYGRLAVGSVFRGLRGALCHVALAQPDCLCT